MKRFFSRLNILGEFLAFLWQRKLWWLIPMIILLVLVGFLIIFSSSSAIAPFIYSLF
jgi:drug/metabolite transporter superfamily protein YnfA